MKTFRHLPLAAMLCACGLAQAATPPRVMFVSGAELQPVIIDLQGREIPARKGQVIPPGYSVKVPEGATVQIMTDEKAIVAIRQNSLLKLEKLGDGTEPHKFKLDIGGLRIANSEKKPHKFEVDTPNAKVKFDKGDHETYYFKEGKIKDKWGTFVRGFKDEAILSTQDGDTKVTREIVAYVPGTSIDGKVEKIARINTSGKISDPLSGLSRAEALADVVSNQQMLNQDGITTKKAALDQIDAPVKDMSPRTLPPLTYATPLRNPVPPPKLVVGLDDKRYVNPIFIKGQDKDILLDQATKTPIVRVGDKFSILSQEKGATAPPISAKELTTAATSKTIAPPPPPPGIDPGKMTKQQQVSTTTRILERQLRTKVR